MSLCFGDFELDQDRRQLLRAGAPVPLEPKAYELLSLLLERRPRALSRTHIRDVVWAGTYVSESTPAVVVNAIRQALGDDAREPRFIRTVHGFGYAFCGEAHESSVEGPEAGEAPAAAGVEVSESSRQQVTLGDGRAERTPVLPFGRRWWVIIGVGVVVAIAAASVVVLRKMSSAEPANAGEPTVVPLTSFPGVEQHPALSPDGTRLAFIWNGPNQDNFDVYVKDIGSGEIVRVTQDPALDFSPVWSPDGKHIAFLRAHDNGSAVFVVSPGGGHERRLTDIAKPIEQENMWLSSLDWSPDGRFLAVADRPPGSAWGVALVSVETGTKQMLTANTDAATTDLFPAFSPDGRRVAFARGHPDVPHQWDLVIQPLSTDRPPRAQGDATVIKGVRRHAITWLPSGDELVVADQRISLDGSPPRSFRLPGSSWIADGQQISIRGTKLAFDTSIDSPQLLRIPLTGDTSAPSAPFFRSTRGEWDPAFAPDGKRVAFGSDRSGKSHIWIGEVDGSASLELPRPAGMGHGGSPSWSPDGRRVAFDAEIGGTYYVYVTAPEGGTLRRLTSGQVPSWSRDGRFIYFVSTRSGDWQLWKMPADAEDTGAVQITRSGGEQADESLDGRYVYYVKPLAPGVFRLPLNGAPAEEKVLDLGGIGLWHLTSRGIFLLDLESGRPTVRFHDLATGRTSVVRGLTLSPGVAFRTVAGAFTVSPDERWALIGTEQVLESDIMLIDGFR